MPDGEVFYSPVEDSAEGVITYAEFPAVYLGHDVVGARLVFRAGEVVEASADEGEEFLKQVLATDEGARRLGELGLGCNPRITRFTRNVLFDEKIDGTVHLAVGASYTYAGGKNESAVHWDMVKDLRPGGELSAGRRDRPARRPLADLAAQASGSAGADPLGAKIPEGSLRSQDQPDQSTQGSTCFRLGDDDPGHDQGAAAPADRPEPVARQPEAEEPGEDRLHRERERGLGRAGPSLRPRLDEKSERTREDAGDEQRAPDRPAARQLDLAERNGDAAKPANAASISACVNATGS